MKQSITSLGTFGLLSSFAFAGSEIAAPAPTAPGFLFDGTRPAV